MRGLIDLFVATLLASTAAAVPLHQHHSRHQHSHQRRQGSTFNIQVNNNCGFSKSAGLFQITSSFQMVSMSAPVNLNPGGSTTIAAPYYATGMRLSGVADQGLAAQWTPSALFEFGYSDNGSQQGTAWDLSMMDGSADNTGISASPDNPSCESKTCLPNNCPLDQGWTSPTQDVEGSPADTVCYQGLTNFVVTFCP